MFWALGYAEERTWGQEKVSPLILTSHGSHIGLGARERPEVRGWKGSDCTFYSAPRHEQQKWSHRAPKAALWGTGFAQSGASPQSPANKSHHRCWHKKLHCMYNTSHTGKNNGRKTLGLSILSFTTHTHAHALQGDNMDHFSARMTTDKVRLLFNSGLQLNELHWLCQALITWPTVAGLNLNSLTVLPGVPKLWGLPSAVKGRLCYNRPLLLSPSLPSSQ